MSGFKVTAPGSSANLGPGFDCLGLAIARHVWASDEPGDVLCDPSHIAHIAYEKAGGTGQIWFGHQLEPGRGLGFSAAARAVGAGLAFCQAGLSGKELLDATYDVVAELEGHGDNAAPSVFGGLNIIVSDVPLTLSTQPPEPLLVWIASGSKSTDASRTNLPTEVPVKSAVLNVGGAMALLASFYEGNSDWLKLANCDQIHQSQRLDSLPDSRKAFEMGQDAGVDGCWLSGSGPSVAFVGASKVLDSLASELPESGRAVMLGVDHAGLVVES